MTFYIDRFFSYSTVSAYTTLAILAISLVVIIYAKIKSRYYLGYDGIIDDIKENNRCLVAAAIIEIPFAFIMLLASSAGNNASDIEMIGYLAILFTFVETILLIIGTVKIVLHSKEQDYVSRKFYIIHRISIIVFVYILLLLMLALIIEIIIMILFLVIILWTLLLKLFYDD